MGVMGIVGSGVNIVVACWAVKTVDRMSRRTMQNTRRHRRTARSYRR